MSQIRFDGVNKEYEHGKVLTDVTFSVDGGEFVFIVGPSGAGKSTIVRLLVREDTPTSGAVYFNDESILGVSREALPALRRKIGVVFQDFKVLYSKSVFENVAVALEVVDSSEEEINNVVPNVLNMVGLADKLYRFPQQLSGGELQRLAIARALAHEPDVLVADEPTGMIDHRAADQVINILETINRMGTTVLVATHNQNIVDKLKKRVIRLEKGVLISDKIGGMYDG
ncbi:ATP-binding cassette domain-containing protein [candidate division WWE3 bacterium]|nr:ATP-binding cassette domain-containing protein [candidate division WWE3 bacterium]